MISRGLIVIGIASAIGCVHPSAQAQTIVVPEITIRPDSNIVFELARGATKLLVENDISGSRRYLLKAADAGNHVAARLIAQSYDPVWLVKHGVEGVAWLADEDEAIRWYERAAELGDKAPGNRYLEAITENH